MEVLPPHTRVPGEPLARRHRPRPGKYRTYSRCLRWEFGFTCAFCLVHERDLNEHGLAGLGLMWIEHYVPQSLRPKLADTYSNCFYSCLYCNKARSNTPPVRGARRLLNPCDAAWSDHFRAYGFRLIPTSDHGLFTADVYDLNDPRRIKLRRNRHRTLTEAFKVIEEAPALITQLLDSRPRTWLERQTHVAVAQQLRARLMEAFREIRRFRAVPTDAPTECRGKDDERLLPDFLQDQVIDVRAR